MSTPKKKLTSSLEDLMKKLLKPYLYVIDIPTGTGKTYSWAKLSATYFLDHFEQVLIFTVQNKLSIELTELLKTFQESKETSLHKSDIIYIERNENNIKRAIEDESIYRLNNEIREVNESGKNTMCSSSYIDALDDLTEKMSVFISTQSDKVFVATEEFKKTESEYRKQIKSCLKKLFPTQDKEDMEYVEEVLKKVPSLRTVFPQVTFKKQKIVVTSINKITCGIDMILTGGVNLLDLSRDQKKRLIIFDESDQCANSIRKELIRQAVDYKNQHKYIGNNYEGVHAILYFVSNRHHFTRKYLNNELFDVLEGFEAEARKLWNSVMGEINYYNDVFLAEDEDETELYNRGLFQVGTGTYIRLSKQQDKPNSYICYNKGDDFFTLVHHDRYEEVKAKYDKVVYLTTFVRLCSKIKTLFFNQITKVIWKDYGIREKAYRNGIKMTVKELIESKKVEKPIIDECISTLFARSKSPNRQMFINSTKAYLSNSGLTRISTDKDSFWLRSNSFYSQGLQMHSEMPSSDDYMNAILLDSRDMYTTAEQMIVSLINGYNTVILSSATASCSSVVANFDLEYFKQVLREKIQFLSQEAMDNISQLLKATYPENYQICVEPIQVYRPEIGHRNQINLPSYYLNFFDPQAVSSGLVDKWFIKTKHEVSRFGEGGRNISYQILYINRLLQFAEVYYKFYHHKDIHSMLYFQNNKGEDNRVQYSIISSLIDGSFKKYQGTEWDWEESLPSWKNDHLYILEDWNKIEQEVLSRLSSDKDEKLMLVAAYNSIKAGCNLQYEIPEGLDVLYGDSWDKSKKDWDAVFLQSVTNYMSSNHNSRSCEESEADIYRILLNEAMFYERGYHSSAEVTSVVNRAVNGIHHFTFKANGLVSLDKSAWIANVLEQSIGRLCRTKNKPSTTYIFYDREIESYSFESVKGKAMTPEFKEFITRVEENAFSDESIEDKEMKQRIRAEKQRVKYANKLYDRAQVDLNIALRYTVNWENLEADSLDKLFEDEVPECVIQARKKYEFLNEVMAKHPTIQSYDELSDNELRVADKLWDKWPVDGSGQYWFYMVKDEYRDYCRLLPHSDLKLKGKMVCISPETTRLSYMMKNPVIKQYFAEKGYATDWKPGMLAIPTLMKDRYKGFIGEQAFIALLLHYKICQPEDIKIMISSFDYELADIVIQDSQGHNLIAFDVKNYNPDTESWEDNNSLTFEEKLKIKMTRLNCRVVVVNVVQLPNETHDAQTRITGLIDQDGNIVFDSLEIIKQMIYEAQRKQ